MVYLFCYQTTETITGRIVEILAHSAGNRAVVIIDIFQVLSARHDIFGMPMLARRNDEITYIAISSAVRIFLYFLHLISSLYAIGYKLFIQCTA